MVEETPHALPPSGGRSRGRGVAILLLAAAILLIPVLYRLAYRERVFPGVRVAGVDLGGLLPAESLARLSEAGLTTAAPVTFAAGERRWRLSPGQSGLAFDARATVAAAYAVGRAGGGPGAFLDMLTARLAGRHLAPVVLFDEAKAGRALADLAAGFDRPATDAGLRIEAGEVLPVPSRTGLALDQARALATLGQAAAAGLWPVSRLDLPYHETAPEVMDAGPAVAAARELLARPLTLRAGEQAWTLAPETLAPMLTTVKEGAHIRLALQPAAFRDWLAPATRAISRTAESPRFHFDAESGRLILVKPGAPGARLDFEATAAALLAAPRSGHSAPLVSVTVPPLVADNIEAASLGIRELVHSETSRYSGSPAERVHNIGVAAARYDGLLIPPEAVFSFNAYLGDVTEAEGYRKSKIIMDGATRDGVGGGICQVSTTLFRAAFFAGLPIVERHAHGYRVGYYEQGSKPGLDATVFSPVVDLKVRNDTGHWLLIQTSSNPRRATVTFQLYGTKPAGRSVRLEGPFESGRTPPPPARVEVDESLPPGASVNAEASRWGGTWRLTRVVLDGEQERREEFVSRYRPTGALTQVGPQPEVAAVPGGAGTAAP